MPKTNNDNNSQKNFYDLVKELLETQAATLKKVNELDEKIERINSRREKDLSKLWEGV